MTRLLTACALIAALGLPAPAAARSLDDRQDVATALLAALAALVVGGVLADRQDDADPPAPQVTRQHGYDPTRPPVVTSSRTLAPRGHEAPVVQQPPSFGNVGILRPRTQDPVYPELRRAQPPRLAARWRGIPLPPICRVKPGVYATDCLVDRMPVNAPLPERCASRMLIDGRVRGTFDADCMRAVGYRTP